MDDIISQINDTLKQIDTDIEIISATKPDSNTIQKLEFIKERLKFDIVQFERLDTAIDSFILASDKFIYEKELLNG